MNKQENLKTTRLPERENTKLKKRRMLSTIVSVILIMGMCMETFAPSTNTSLSAEKKQRYIIVTQSEDEVSELEENYLVADTVSKEVENNSVGDKMTTLEILPSESERIKRTTGVVSVEKDLSMTGSGKKDINENSSISSQDLQWNLKMIKSNHSNKLYSHRDSKNKKKIKVALIDSGVDYSDDIDVVERKNFIPGQEKISPLYEDGSGHGTSVAGIIAAKNNDVGISGINSDIELYSAKVLDENNQSPISRVIEAIDWAVNKNVNIINMSLGISTYSKSLHEAIKRADKNGVLVIAAAGNGGKVEYPAAFEETLAVGSVRADGTISENSSIGSEIDVVAPGEQIMSTAAFGGVMSSSGTSMAAPHVTGMASILLAKSKIASARFVKKLICNTARQCGDESLYGNGVIDIDYALENYDSSLKNYVENKECLSNKESDYVEDMLVSPNNREVESFEENEIASGRWSKTNHVSLADKAEKIAGGLSSTDLKIVKKGIVAQDQYLVFSADNSKTDKYKTFHAYNNYVNAYAYVMEMAKKCKKSGLAKAKEIKMPNKNSADNEDCKNIKAAISESLLNKILGVEKKTNKNYALVLMGIAMHIVSDTYAHRTYVNDQDNGVWKKITHDNGADSSDKSNKHKGSVRFKAAGYAVGEVLALWNGNCPASFEEWDLIGIYDHSGSFKLISYKDYASRTENGIDYNYYKKHVEKLSY